MVKPILFLTTNLSNCVSRRTQYFFDFGTVAKMHRKPDLFIKKHLDNQVASYHENKYGESVLFYPGQIENQKVFKFRIRQGIVDIIIEHFMQMEQNLNRDQNATSSQILIMCTHHYALQQLLQLFQRRSLAASSSSNEKPKYCWTAAMEVEISRKELEAYMRVRESAGASAHRLGGLPFKNDLLDLINVRSFNVVDSEINPRI